MVCYAGSGHRPQNLGLTYSDEDQLFLVDFLVKQINNIPDLTKGISGMASGFDICYALALIKLNKPFIAALPFQGQENKWPVHAQKQYAEIIAKAENIHFVHDYYKGNWQYAERDKWMVDNSDKLLCLWNTKLKKSGTKLTAEYAIEQDKPVINLWDIYKYESVSRVSKTKSN